MVRKSVALDFNSAVAQLRDNDVLLSRNILSALSNTPKRDLASFAQAWSEMRDERRRRAAHLFVEMAEENFELDFNLLYRHLLNDQDAAVRVSAIEGLWEDQDSALVKLFIGALRSDPDARVRAAAADALGRFLLLAEYERLSESHATMVFDALLATIRSHVEESNVLCRSVEALGYSSRPLVRDVINAAYDDADAQMRASALAAMGHTADTYWRKTIQDELESPDPVMRHNAARAAGELEDRDAVPRLIELLDDPDREVQAAAVASLGQIGSKPAQNALRLVSESDDEVLRELANESLLELDFMSDSDFLMFDLNEDDGDDEDEEDLEDESK
jgi:HEAT repeat protein